MERKIVSLTITLIVLILVLLLAVGGFVFLRLSSQSNTLEAADAFLSEQNPAQALSEYASLLKNEFVPLVFLEKNNIELAEAGVLRSADMILSDEEAVKQLISGDVLNSIRAESKHPSVSESFLEELQIRIRYIDLLKAGTSQEAGKDLASPYSKTLAGFMTSLFQQGAVLSRDQRLASQVWDAFDSFRMDDAKRTASEISDEALRTSTLAAIDQRWAEHLVSLHDLKKNTVYAGAWYSFVYDDVSKLCGDARYAGLEESFAGADFVSGGAFSFIIGNRLNRDFF